MDDGIELEPPINASHARSIACFLGSFDPPHLGHEAIVRRLLEESDSVMMLVPAIHFHKQPRAGQNATFAQRIAMLSRLRGDLPRAVDLGLTHTVLFMQLDSVLRARFPCAEVLFAMGDETYSRLLDSASYYQRSGMGWNSDREQALQHLRTRCRVWNRSGASSGVHVPDDMRGISSTLVRSTVRGLWQQDASADRWEAELRPLVSCGVSRMIRSLELYRG